MQEGLTNGAMVLFPCMAAVYAGLQNPSFRKFTNWQSRTALAIMPAMFVFALTSEQKMVHRMEEVATETEHAIKSVEWADRHHRKNSVPTADEQQKREELRELYRRSILNSNVRVVEGEELTMFHQAANYVQSNPFKLILSIGIPAVAYIFYGKTGKDHLSMQLKILHTRVLGQFTVICTLLGVMGLKEMMDRQGKFITQAEVENRVLEMERTRMDLMDRLDYQARQSSTMKGRHSKD